MFTATGASRFCKRTAAVLFVNLIFTAFAAAQATQPTPDAWDTVIEQVSSSLPADGQNDTLARLIPDETAIQQFDSVETETRFRTAEKLNHMSVLWQRSYTNAPPKLVSDLSNSLGDNADVPMTLKQQLIPKDPAAVTKADMTAQRWITRMLSPEPASLISVILFWDRQPKDTTAPIPREPIFVLIKGRLAGDAPIITQIRYGQMSQALN